MFLCFVKNNAKNNCKVTKKDQQLLNHGVIYALSSLVISFRGDDFDWQAWTFLVPC